MLAGASHAPRMMSHTGRTSKHKLHCKTKSHRYCPETTTYTSVSCPPPPPAGNILVGAGGRVGLLDYGQSKQLPDEQRMAFAELVVALHKWVPAVQRAAVQGPYT